MLKKDRDLDLDKLRGLAMIYIMFIHTIYGVGLFEGETVKIIKSYFLIEMPIFFFITGASNYYSKYSSKIEFILKKFKRILIPYYIFAFIIIILNYIIPILFRFKYVFSPINWLLPFADKQQSFFGYFVWPLWFVPVYLMVMIIFPYLKEYYIKKEKEKSLDVYLPFLYIFLNILIIDFYDIIFPIFLKKIIFYSFFAYLGLFWNKIKILEKKDKDYKNKMFMIITVAGFVCIFLILTSFFGPNMQSNKQSANLVFMVYGLIGVSFMCMIYKYIIRFIDNVCKVKYFDWIFSQYKNNTYTIYFFHMIALYIVKIILDYGFKSLSNDIIIFIIRILILIPLSASFGYLFGFIENIDLNFCKEKYRKLWNKIKG